MKTFFTSLILSFITLVSFGQYSQVNSQSLTINFKGDQNFMAIIDGQTYYSDGKDGKWDDNRNNRRDDGRNTKFDDNDIKLNLQPGQHSITVYKMNDNRGNRNDNDNRNGNRNGNNNGNGNRNGNGQWNRNVSQNNRVVYASTFILKRGYSMHFVIQGNGRAQITEERNRSTWGRGNDRNNGGNNNGYPNNRYRTPMADYQFNQILKDANGKWFQSGKVTAVRADFNNTANLFSTFQARQLLLLISAEGDKLELAKLAFDNIADPQNFSQLYDIFNSQYSRDELDRYTRSKRF